MASSSSLKELSKAITSYLAEPALPLPDDVVSAIDDYLDKHQTYDDAVADRLQEELVGVFEKYVRGRPAATGPWMGILTRIQWALQSPEKVLYWFDACQNILDNTPLDKGVVKETIAAMMNTASLADKCQSQGSQEGESSSSPIIERLLSIWIEKFYPAYIEGNKSVEYNEKMLRGALGHYAKKRPKEFFASLNNHFLRKGGRRAVLRFFCDFIQGQPPHLYQVLQSPLWNSLLLSLQLDTSTTIVSAALTALIMLFPHMPSALVPYLPVLFNIYARLLFWEQERTGAVETPSLDSPQAADWEACVFDSSTEEDMAIGHLSQYYTLLYGLYPINFMDYIRKPQRYLRHAETSDSNSIELQPTEIRHHSERFCRMHVLHPNFYTMTIESEKTDFERWMKMEAAEVITECMSLCVSADHSALPDSTMPPMQTSTGQESAEAPQRNASEPALLRVDNWRKSQFSSADSVSSDRTPSMVRRGSQSSQPSNRDSGEPKAKLATDSPTMQTQLTQSPSHTQLQDMLKSNKVIKSGLHQTLANDSVPSLALSHQESLADRSGRESMPPPALPAMSGSTLPVNVDLNSQVVKLQRRVLLLENDLTFERYLKQQHISHIGDLRRRHVEIASTEAGTQNLLMTNRSLKSRYEEAKKVEMQVRKESEKSRAMAKKWEADLSNKVKTMREDAKKTASELSNVQKELDVAKEECGKLRNLLCEAEVKELNWKQHMQSIEIHGIELERLREEVTRLTVAERDAQAKDQAREAAMNEATGTQNKMAELNMKLTAQEGEVQRTRKLFQSQIAALQEQLSEVQEERLRPGANSNLAIESALAASRAKQAELQKQYDLLQRKYKTLQSSLLDMSAETSDATGTSPRDADYLSISASPVMMRARTHRVLSNAESEMNPQHVTPPLDPSSGAALTAVSSHRQASPPGKDGRSSKEGAGPSRSLEQRHFGAGLHSRLRRDGSDKGKSEEASSSSSKPKKEKKSTLRGIRGFV